MSGVSHAVNLEVIHQAQESFPLIPAHQAQESSPNLVSRVVTIITGLVLRLIIIHKENFVCNTSTEISLSYLSGKIIHIAKDLEIWIMAQKQFGLSHKHIQMARELGLNPKKFGSLSNHKQQPWKAPLPQFIESIYFKHFKRELPEMVKAIAQIIAEKKKKKDGKKKNKMVQKKNEIATDK